MLFLQAKTSPAQLLPVRHICAEAELVALHERCAARFRNRPTARALVSVVNSRTTSDDVDVTIAAVARVLTGIDLHL